jgi:hypothetical protein
MTAPAARSTTGSRSEARIQIDEGQPDEPMPGQAGEPMRPDGEPDGTQPEQPEDTHRWIRVRSAEAEIALPLNQRSRWDYPGAPS